MEYGWKDGSRIKLNAQEVGEFLDSQSLSGPGDAREILEAGRNPASPIHSHFEWNNEIAGEEYRLVQARKLAASLVTIVEDPSCNRIPTRRYFTVYRSKESAKEYVKREIVLNDEEKYLQFLDQALKEFEGMRRRYLTVIELNEIWDITAKIKAKLG